MLRHSKFKWLNGENYVQSFSCCCTIFDPLVSECLFPQHVSVQMWYLRMATVRASGEVAHGQITSGFRPWDWNTFRKASHDDTDPDNKQWDKSITKTGSYIEAHIIVVLSYNETMFLQERWLTWVCSISHNEHTYGGQVGVLLVFVGHHGPVEVTALHQGHTCYQRVKGICYLWCTYILQFQYAACLISFLFFFKHIYQTTWTKE